MGSRDRKDQGARAGLSCLLTAPVRLQFSGSAGYGGGVPILSSYLPPDSIHPAGSSATKYKLLPEVEEHLTEARLVSCGKMWRWLEHRSYFSGVSGLPGS